MGRPSINAIHKNAHKQLQIVERFLIKAQKLSPDLYGFVAEMMMLRIFSTIEYVVRETAVRLACGFPYRNGVNPTNIIHKCSTLSDAINQFKSFGRGAKQKSNLQFTNVKNTNDCIKFIIDAPEPFRKNIQIHGTSFEEMRKIRNHIAHRTNSTRKDYNTVIRLRYGGTLKLKIYSFLTSTKRQPLPIIMEYLIKARIMIDEITVA